MSKFLYKIGKGAYEKPWAFIASWLIILGVIVTAIFTAGINVSTETRIDGTEAQNILDQLEKEYPAASGGQGSFILEVPEGEKIDAPENLGALAKAIDKTYKLNYVINPMDMLKDEKVAAQLQEMQSQLAQIQTSKATYRPLLIQNNPVPGVKISEKGNIALFQFQLTEQADQLSDKQVSKLHDIVASAEKGTSIQVHSTGAFEETDIPIGGIHEVIGLAIAAVILVITLGSLIAAGLPLVIALIGVGIGVGGTFAFSTIFEINSLTPVLALMVGLAVGIDYALFIVNRQRKLMLEEDLTAKEAAARSIGTAGSAVFFAGLTVIIALCGLLVIGIDFLSSMAIVASLTIFIDVLVALTLLPALLGLVGDRIVKAKARRKHIEKSSKKATFSSHWIHNVLRFKWLAVILVILFLGTIALPMGKMDLGMPSGESANKDTAQRQSYDIIADAFGEGYNGPLLLVAENKDSKPLEGKEYMQLISNISKLKAVTEVSPGGLSEDAKLGIISIVPSKGPTDKVTHDLVNDLRNDKDITKNTNLDVGVTGLTAVNIDISDKLAEVFPIYIGIIVVLSFVILMLVFRSVIIPIKATVGFLLSVIATFGATTAVFQWGWFGSLFGIDTGGPLLSFIPIFLTGILYGLAMDYQVFLVSSMREAYVHGKKGDSAIISGYTVASKVVVSAALIMVSVFSGFIFTDDIMIKQIGFALAFGILIDAFLIRMIFVPAVMSIFGDKVWWIPKWMDRIMPNFDIEGEKLIEELNKKQHAEEKASAQ